jgi:hypothetical protein
MSKRKLEATRANQARKTGDPSRRLPPGAKVPSKRGGGLPPWMLAAGGIVVVVVIAAIAFFVLRGDDKGGSPKAISWGELPGMQTGPAPWTEGLDQLRTRLDDIGLQALPQEAVAQHIHQHLDLWIDGKKQTVPADIGIDVVNGFITELHVHEGEEGTIHVESPDQRDFTLGEFFAVWGVKLTKNCIGMYCATSAKPVKWWVNGKPLTSVSPEDLLLRSHQEIVGVYGKPPATIPKSWKFQEGE